MKIKLAALFTATLTTALTMLPLNAATFEEQDLDQSSVVAIARPYGQSQYDLLVIEQIPQKQSCWQENGAKPVSVDPLLLKFDFTGICRRSTDSNGYSIRLNGEDQGLNYILRVIPREGELVLVGTNRNNPKEGEILIGRTQGMSSGFLKIVLEPGWRITKRAYKGKMLGHVYFSNSGQQVGNAENNQTPVALPVDPVPESTAKPVTPTK